MSPEFCQQIGRMEIFTPKVLKNANSINWAQKVPCDRAIMGGIWPALGDPGGSADGQGRPMIFYRKNIFEKIPGFFFEFLLREFT
jgi:hypothetical protein